MLETISMPATLPKLPYELNALQPFISEEIMNLHYNKHHQAYVNNLNKAMESFAEAEKKNDLPAMLAQQSAIKFNGGGHINHSIFWTNLSPAGQNGGKIVEGALKEAIVQQFGSMDKFIEGQNPLPVFLRKAILTWGDRVVGLAISHPSGGQK